MGAIVSSIASTCTMCLGYCACQSVASLCQSCCGNTSGTGRKRSVVLLALSIILSVLFQHKWAADLSGGNALVSHIPYLGTQITNAWTDGCMEFEDDDAESLKEKCISNAGVYRVNFITILFFSIMMVATSQRASLNSQAWPSKYVLFTVSVLLSIFVPNSYFSSGFFLGITRLGACLFIIFQQIVLIDLAYSWNESWVEKSTNAFTERERISWLLAILACTLCLYGTSLGLIITLFNYFSGCGALNRFLIAMTLTLIIVATVVQLSGEEGNLLTSSVISMYSVYLLIEALSHHLNDDTCDDSPSSSFFENHENIQVWVGMSFTILSVIWTGWSWTEDRVLTTIGMEEDPNHSNKKNGERPLDGLDIPLFEDQNTAVQGVVVGSSDDIDNSNNELWKLNLVLMLISCWVVVILTGWASVETNGDVVYLWFIIVSQWFSITTYIWTLLAPNIFPDRDFS